MYHSTNTCPRSGQKQFSARGALTSSHVSVLLQRTVPSDTILCMSRIDVSIQKGLSGPSCACTQFSEITRSVPRACHHGNSFVVDNGLAASVATLWLGSSPSQRRHQPHAQLNRYLRKHWCPPLPPIQWQGSAHRAPPHRRDSAVGPIWGPTAPPGHQRPHFVGFIETLKSASDHQTVLTECLAKSRVLAKLVSESSRPRPSSLLRLART